MLITNGYGKKVEVFSDILYTIKEIYKKTPGATWGGNKVMYIEFVGQDEKGTLIKTYNENCMLMHEGVNTKNSFGSLFIPPLSKEDIL